MRGILEDLQSWRPSSSKPCYMSLGCKRRILCPIFPVCLAVFGCILIILINKTCPLLVPKGQDGFDGIHKSGTVIPRVALWASGTTRASLRWVLGWSRHSGLSWGLSGLGLSGGLAWHSGTYSLLFWCLLMRVMDVVLGEKIVGDLKKLCKSILAFRPVNLTLQGATESKGSLPFTALDHICICISRSRCKMLQVFT
jgi:hypothetical protein